MAYQEQQLGAEGINGLAWWLLASGCNRSARKLKGIAIERIHKGLNDLNDKGEAGSGELGGRETGRQQRAWQVANKKRE